MGFRIGHWTDSEGSTGCTVVLPPPGNVTSCDIRGSSPSERELTLLHPDRRLTEVHAVLLTGGSAFGLAAADGVVSWLEERGIGYETPAGRVPIVPAAVVFDLGTGRADVRPGPAEGRAACDAATGDAVASGRVGAGAGATVGKWSGPEHASPGGVGVATVSGDGLTVSAIAVVNSVGDVIDGDGTVLAGSRLPPASEFAPAPIPSAAPASTVIGLVATESNLDKREVRWLAARGSDGITVSIRPAHTRYDGDVVLACAAPRGDSQHPHELDILGRLATQAMASAIRDAVTVPPE